MFVKDYPALKLEHYLIVADLHIGITRELWEHGFSLPPQTGAMAQKINRLLKRTRAKEVVLLGDVKHKVPGTYRQEAEQIPKLLEEINKPVTIIKGNHDGDIEKIVDVPVKKKMKIGDYLLTHGHISATGKKIIIGHNHPLIKFRDPLGNIYTEQIWIRNKKPDITIMPAFNELSGGHCFNQKLEPMGPVAEKINKKARAFLFDGTGLGTLDKLELRE